jgi:Protein of unknown function (DUF3788)
MNALAPNAFIGKKEAPTEAELGKALGAANPVWHELVAGLAAEFDVGIQEWNSYSPKAGWSLRLKRGKRTILWLAPCEGCFRVAIILGEKAVKAARESGLSPRVLKMIDSAKKYPEGTAIRLQIKGTKEIPTVKKLAEIKLQN